MDSTSSEQVTKRVVTVSLDDREQKQRWKEHARKNFRKNNPNAINPGNMSQMVKTYVNRQIQKQESGSKDLERLKQKVEGQKQRIKALEEQKRELKSKLKQKDYRGLDVGEVSENRKLILQIHDCLRYEKSLDQLVEELESSLNLEEFSSPEYGDKPGTIVYSALKHLIHNDEVETREVDGEQYYNSKKR